MPKITFMGAGSTVFAKNVLGDSMLTPALAHSDIALYDIDPQRLEESELMLKAINKWLGNPAKIYTYLGAENRIFIVDEPTDGLHVKDIRHIIRLFDSLVERGNSVYMIEHNLDVIRSADFLLELGPGAGEDGGRILYKGFPAGMAGKPDSVTAKYL